MVYPFDFLDFTEVFIEGLNHLFPESLLTRSASVDGMSPAVKEDINSEVFFQLLSQPILVWMLPPVVSIDAEQSVFSSTS